MRALFAAALLVAGAASPAARAAAPNDIIWDPPKAGPTDATKTPGPSTAPAGQPDSNGIIWDTPASSQAPKTAAAPAAKTATDGAPDANGIVWNAPPSKAAGSAAPRVTQAPGGDGPCREFQTTIVIDGRQEPAHGTVCRQPDGTWRLVNK